MNCIEKICFSHTGLVQVPTPHQPLPPRLRVPRQEGNELSQAHHRGMFLFFLFSSSLLPSLIPLSSFISFLSSPLLCFALLSVCCEPKEEEWAIQSSPLWYVSPLYLPLFLFSCFPLALRLRVPLQASKELLQAATMRLYSCISFPSLLRSASLCLSFCTKK